MLHTAPFCVYVLQLFFVMPFPSITIIPDNRFREWLNVFHETSSSSSSSSSSFIIMEKTEAGLRGLCIREIDVKSQILVT